MKDVQLEFVHDYLDVAGDEETVVGYASPQANGEFVYRPYDLESGDLRIRARPSFCADRFAKRAVANGIATRATGGWSARAGKPAVAPAEIRMTAP